MSCLFCDSTGETDGALKLVKCLRQTFDLREDETSNLGIFDYLVNIQKRMKHAEFMWHHTEKRLREVEDELLNIRNNTTATMVMAPPTYTRYKGF